ncbi:DUF2877 domain-containing protein [Enterococcus sp. AZ163]|uniref:DUF2877 domain-containing protein n=1 Tax=Enterococcus sp. AZ163 TaxID=2774638 RepID=UPI003D28C240
MKNTCQISSYLATLDCFGKIGQVHSVFQHSFNLIITEHLLHVTDTEDFLSSFGIRITTESFEAVKPFCRQGNVVKLTPDSMIFYSHKGTKKIKFSSVDSVPLELSTIFFNSTVLRTMIAELENFQLQPQLGLIIEEKESAFFEFLMRPNPDSEVWNQLTTYFIGRGQGLTPSGDDLLMGYLFVLISYQLPEANQLMTALASKTDRTTIVSQNYLEAMIAGFASSPFVELQQKMNQAASEAVLAQALQRILSIGETSGKDTAYGILLGLNAVKNK